MCRRLFSIKDFLQLFWCSNDKAINDDHSDICKTPHSFRRKMTRATHLSSIVIALITLTTALVPPQVNKADHAVRDLSPREICAADKKILLDAAAAGLKPVHAAADSFPRKRQLPNEFCVQDALLSSFQSDPEATSLCAALIGDVPVTVTVSTSGST